MRLLLLRGPFQVFSAQDVEAEAKAWQIASAVQCSVFSGGQVSLDITAGRA
jgi:hypothetical protein